jgi:AraC-like DNA-binding protein
MSVSIFLVRAIVDAVERSGADLRAHAPLDWQRLGQTETRIELEQFAQMLSVAVTLTRDEALGLHLAEQVTLRAAVEICSQFTALAMDGLRLLSRDSGDTFVIRYALPRSTPVADRVLAELVVGGMVRLARAFYGPSVVPLKVTFEHDRPRHHREVTRIFGANCRFGQATTSIAFDGELADRDQLHQHPELFNLLRTEAARRLDRLSHGASPAADLRDYLLATPLSRIPNIATAARELGTSERSLRRRLTEDGTSYRDVVRSALEASAGLMLRDPSRTIKETSVALGFADAAAFHRAFKRWTGMTPGEYRRSKRGR